MKWRARSEKRLIRKYGGRHDPDRNKGDGYIRDRVVEVKEVRKDSRFRINKDNHEYMVRNNGAYIFADGNGHDRKVSAKQVSGIIGRGKWFKDRSYPHKFVKRNEIF